MSSSELIGTRAAQPLDDLLAFASLPETVRELVAASFRREVHAFGDEVVRQGDAPSGLYVVASGRLRAIRTEHGAEYALGVLTPGQVFGEAGLLDGTPARATVRASAPSETLRLEPGLFAALVRLYPEVGERLRRVAQQRWRGPLLRTHAVFATLPAAAVDALVADLDERAEPAGTLIFAAGDPPGPLYLVVEGRLRVTAPDGATLRHLRAGDLFGELSVYTGAARSATVKAVTDVRLMALAGDVFRRLLDAYPELHERVADQLALYERGPSRAVPLDFADELPPATPSVVSGTEAMPPAVSAPRPSLRRRHVPHVRQLDEADCGVACLVMCCRTFGHPVSRSHLRDVMGTSVAGTSLAGIQRGAAVIGLDVRALKASKDRLDELDLPAVAHWRGDHWVVLDDVREDRVHIADPAVGPRWLDRTAFLRDWTGYCALVAPTERLRDAPRERTELRWLAPLVRPHARAFALATLLILFAAGVQMLIPVLAGRVVDSVLPDGDTHRLTALSVAMLGLIVLALAASLAVARLLASMTLRIDAATLDHVAGRLLRLPMRYFETRRTGDLERRLDGMREVREFVVGQGTTALASLAALVVAFILMLVTSPPLGLLWLATAPVYLAVMRFAIRRLRPAVEDREEGFARYRSRQIDGIHGIETVKSLGAEEPLRRRMVGDFDDLATRVLRADRLAITYSGLAMFASATLLLVFLYLGARLVIAGHLSVGGLVAFNSLVLLANGPLVALLGVCDHWQHTSVLLRRMQDIVDERPEQPATARLRAVPTLEGRVTLRDVGFRHPQTPEIPILEGVSLDVRPGTTVALVGRSGAGKSTLLKCLAGLVEASEGTITFDGVDLRELDWGALRRRIGFVPQRPHVFDDTIARNIAFGEPAPDIDAVRAAAELADAREFIERLPLGYETRVGDGGLRLSGGQAQRLAIARALYHRPPVVMLDEATSALDPEAERAVTHNISRLIDGRTAFIVANRLSTIRDADVIVVLERGRIAETGDHGQLIARGGLYLHLYGQQLET